jgi:DNA-binding transcriptional LysR family regulator
MNQYEVFITVVESGSYSAAAKQLFKSPSAISKQISALEESLGVQLFDRTTRSLSVTEEGTLYYEHCKEISAKIKTAESEIRSAAGEPSGNIKITWPSGLSYSKLSTILGKFTLAYPKITLEIISSNDVLNLVDKSIDIAFRSSPNIESDLNGVELFSAKPIVCASPEFVSRYGYPKSLDDLACMPNILPSYINFGQKVRATFPNSTRPKMEEQHRSDDILSIYNMAKSGIGAAFIFEHIIQDDLDSGQLLNILPNLPLPMTPIYLIHHRNNHMPKKLRLFIDFFKREFLYPDEALSN